jgi:hypothetical protein
MCNVLFLVSIELHHMFFPFSIVNNFLYNWVRKLLCTANERGCYGNWFSRHLPLEKHPSYLTELWGLLVHKWLIYGGTSTFVNWRNWCDVIQLLSHIHMQKKRTYKGSIKQNKIKTWISNF